MSRVILHATLLTLGLLPSFSWASSQRVVSTSPSLTELIFQLGHGQELVGTSDYSDYPDAAKLLPRIGSLYLPNLERVFRLKPKWIISDTYTQNPSFLEAAKNISSVLEVKIDSITQLFLQSKKILQTLFGEEGSSAVAQYERILNARATSRHQPFSYLVLVWMNPNIVYGDHLLLPDILSKLGGTNLVPKTIANPYPQVSEEWLLKHKPDVLFYLVDFPEMNEMVRKQAKAWWPNQSVHLQPLSGNHFARTSFTPILHLDELVYGPHQ